MGADTHHVCTLDMYKHVTLLPGGLCVVSPDSFDIHCHSFSPVVQDAAVFGAMSP